MATLGPHIQECLSIPILILILSLILDPRIAQWPHLAQIFKYTSTVSTSLSPQSFQHPNSYIVEQPEKPLTQSWSSFIDVTQLVPIGPVLVNGPGTKLVDPILKHAKCLGKHHRISRNVYLDIFRMERGSKRVPGWFGAATYLGFGAKKNAP